MTPWKCQMVWRALPTWSITASWCEAKIVRNCCRDHFSSRLATPRELISAVACGICNWIRCRKVRTRQCFASRPNDTKTTKTRQTVVSSNGIYFYSVIFEMFNIHNYNRFFFSSPHLLVSFRQFAVLQNRHRTSCGYSSGIFYHNVRIPMPSTYLSTPSCVRLSSWWGLSIWNDILWILIDWGR